MSGSHSHPLARHPARKTIKPIHFVCLAANAKRVTVVGDFNDWDPNAHPMRHRVDGSWAIEIPLGHGHHHYLFMVDGKPTLDPRAHGIARNEQNEKVCLLAVS